MTIQELNRDIKRLHKLFLNRRNENTTNWTNKDWDEYQSYDDKIKAEFKRLYYADKDFEAMNKQSLLILLSINSSMRIIALHVFGAIELK